MLPAAVDAAAVDAADACERTARAAPFWSSKQCAQTLQMGQSSRPQRVWCAHEAAVQGCVRRVRCRYVLLVLLSLALCRCVLGCLRAIRVLVDRAACARLWSAIWTVGAVRGRAPSHVTIRMLLIIITTAVRY